jgi:hypothetical protein
MGAKTEQNIGRGKHGLGAVTGDKKMKEREKFKRRQARPKRRSSQPSTRRRRRLGV